MTKTNGYNQMSPWYPIIPVKIIQNLHFVPIIVTLFHHFPMIDKYIYIYKLHTNICFFCIIKRSIFPGCVGPRCRAATALRMTQEAATRLAMELTSCGNPTHFTRVFEWGEVMSWLPGWWLKNPFEKYEFVSWDDDIPNIWNNHQPVTTYKRIPKHLK